MYVPIASMWSKPLSQFIWVSANFSTIRFEATTLMLCSSILFRIYIHILKDFLCNPLRTSSQHPLFKRLFIQELIFNLLCLKSLIFERTSIIFKQSEAERFSVHFVTLARILLQRACKLIRLLLYITPMLFWADYSIQINLALFTRIAIELFIFEIIPLSCSLMFNCFRDTLLQGPYLHLSWCAYLIIIFVTSLAITSDYVCAFVAHLNLTTSACLC